MPPAVTARPSPTEAREASIGMSVSPVPHRPLFLPDWVGCVGVLGRDAVLAGWQRDPAGLELRHERRPDPGRLELALDLAVAERRLLEGEDVLGQDLVIVDPVDLGDVDDLARPVLESGGVDDQVDRRGDLVADRAEGQLVAGHQDHRLEPSQHVRRRVRVTGRERPVLAGRHRLEHVQRLARATLPDDDPVGPHVEGIAEQVADGDLALTLDVRRPGLELDHVRLAQLELGGVLDRDDPLVLGDERRQDVEGGGLARAGAARYEDVESRLDAGAQELEHLGGRRPERDRCRRR